MSRALPYILSAAVAGLFLVSCHHEYQQYEIALQSYCKTRAELRSLLPTLAVEPMCGGKQ